MRSLRLITALALGLLPGALAAQQPMVLEAEPGVDELAICDTAHNILTCERRHIDKVEEAALTLDGEEYVIEWKGPGYYLENGLVVQPLGTAKTALKGQSWLEVYPRNGRVHTSQVWKDLDADRRLSVSDTLVLDSGREVRIKDVRLQVRVRPVSAPSMRPEKPQGGEGPVRNR
jgi:hypothetical protein